MHTRRAVKMVQFSSSTLYAVSNIAKIMGVEFRPAAMLSNRRHLYGLYDVKCVSYLFEHARSAAVPGSVM